MLHNTVEEEKYVSFASELLGAESADCEPHKLTHFINWKLKLLIDGFGSFNGNNLLENPIALSICVSVNN